MKGCEGKMCALLFHSTVDVSIENDRRQSIVNRASRRPAARSAPPDARQPFCTAMGRTRTTGWISAWATIARITSAASLKDAGAWPPISSRPYR
jgi:hypothetical protein